MRAAVLSAVIGLGALSPSLLRADARAAAAANSVAHAVAHGAAHRDSMKPLLARSAAPPCATEAESTVEPHCGDASRCERDFRGAQFAGQLDDDIRGKARTAGGLADGIAAFRLV
jgi:hypothetical protein